MKKIVFALFLAILPLTLSAQTVPNVDSNDNFAWNQTGANLAEVQAFVYKYYLDGATTGSVFTGVTCAGTVSPFTCQVRTPTFAMGQHTVALTAASASGESVQSVPFSFVYGNPPQIPNNIRVIRNP